MEYKISLVDYNLSIEQLKKFYGFEDVNLHMIEKTFNCNIKANSESLIVESLFDISKQIEKCVALMVNKILKKVELDIKVMQDILNLVSLGQEEVDEKVKFVTTYNGKIIRPKNQSQYAYYKLLEKNTIVFAMGAAGTGKTYLAVAYGVNMLKQKKVNKIIITRPIVEAGENLGFLPGELKEKVDPYLTPIYDALHDILGKETTDKYLEKGIIEIAPRAYMRGRTLSDAFVILDEAQNTTPMQMKMFLTRLGENSRMVVNGDLSQVDLPRGVISGLRDALDTLKGIKNIGSVTFSANDVVRHGLVAKIVKAYEEKIKRERDEE